MPAVENVSFFPLRLALVLLVTPSPYYLACVSLTRAILFFLALCFCRLLFNWCLIEHLGNQFYNPGTLVGQQLSHFCFLSAQVTAGCSVCI